MKHTTVNKNNLPNALSKSLPTMCTLSEELSNRYNYFLRLTVFPELFVKVFLINFNFFLTCFFWRFFAIKSILIYEYKHKATLVNARQNEPTHVRRETARAPHESTQANTSSTKVNTSQHESKTGLDCEKEKYMAKRKKQNVPYPWCGRLHL